MGVKINFRIIRKIHAADPEMGFLTKSISKPYGRATAIPPARKLTFCFESHLEKIKKFYESFMKCSRFSDTVFHKIDFTADGFHKDHPPA